MSAPHPGWSDIQATLFDLDGTLVHTPIDFPAMKQAVLEATEAEGFDAGSFRGLDVLGIIGEAARRLKDPSEFRKRTDKILQDIEVEAAHRGVEAAGAGETLSWLMRHGIRVGIVTRNCPEAVAITLSRTPLPHHVLVTRSDTPHVKPHPEHLWLALRKLERRPENALMIGDHRMDILGGIAAGMRTAGIVAHGGTADAFADPKPDILLLELPELRRWISPSSL